VLEYAGGAAIEDQWGVPGTRMSSLDAVGKALGQDLESEGSTLIEGFLLSRAALRH